MWPRFGIRTGFRFKVEFFEDQSLFGLKRHDAGLGGDAGIVSGDCGDVLREQILNTDSLGVALKATENKGAGDPNKGGAQGSNGQKGEPGVGDAQRASMV